MIEKIKQYKNLILLVIAILLVIGLVVCDPLGLLTERRHQRSMIQNQIAIEKAETEQRIAIIKAETNAELVRIQSGLPLEEAEDEVIITGPTETEETE